MATYLVAALRQQLLDADDHCCAYCGTPQANSGAPMVVDHILPRSKGGATQFENLCFACYQCNLYKGSSIEAVDPLSGTVTLLFDPRRHIWTQHFRWDDAGLRIIGLTATGRATVNRLRMNNAVILEARRNWVRLGWRPLAVQQD